MAAHTATNRLGHCCEAKRFAAASICQRKVDQNASRYAGGGLGVSGSGTTVSAGRSIHGCHGPIAVRRSSQISLQTHAGSLLPGSHHRFLLFEIRGCSSVTMSTTSLRIGNIVGQQHHPWRMSLLSFLIVLPNFGREAPGHRMTVCCAESVNGLTNHLL